MVAAAALAGLLLWQQQPRASQLVDAGVKLSNAGRFTEAAEQFVQALALDPRLAEAHYLLGLIRQQDGRGIDARESFTAAIRLDPRFAPAQARLCELDAAAAREKETGYEAALAACRRATLLDPRDPEPRFHTGWLLSKQGAFAAAAQAFQAVLGLNAVFPNAKFELAMAYADAGNPAQALPLLKQVVAAEPRNGQAKFQLGSALAKQNDCAGAAPLLQAAAEGAQKHYLLAACLKKLGRETEAAAEFALFKQGRADAEARMQAKYRAALAHRYAEAGKFAEAIAEYRGALVLTPGDVTLKVDLAVALLKKGDKAAVIELLAGESSPLARYQVALAQPPAEATRTLEQLAIDQPGFAEAWYQLGVVRSGTGDHAQAASAFATAARLRPDSTEFRRAARNATTVHK